MPPGGSEPVPCVEDHPIARDFAIGAAKGLATVPRMEQPQTFTWDVFTHPTLIEWFDALRDVGWYRDPSVPGVKTPDGTIEYSFHYLEREAQLGA